MNRLQQKLLDEISEAAAMGVIELTEWEDEFIDSLATREPNYELSERQNAVLNRISQKQFRG